jgi:hypothetical protein
VVNKEIKRKPFQVAKLKTEERKTHQMTIEESKEKKKRKRKEKKR